MVGRVRLYFQDLVSDARYNGSGRLDVSSIEKQLKRKPDGTRIWLRVDDRLPLQNLGTCGTTCG
jgi:hypothetical protein